MKKIKLSKDQIMNAVFHKAGEELEVKADYADFLIAQNLATEVTPPPPPIAPKTAK